MWHVGIQVTLKTYDIWSINSVKFSHFSEHEKKQLFRPNITPAKLHNLNEGRANLQQVTPES